MKLEEKDIREFIDLWQKEFDESISPEEAECRASQLLELYFVLSQPDEKAQTNTLEDESQIKLP